MACQGRGPQEPRASQLGDPDGPSYGFDTPSRGLIGEPSPPLAEAAVGHRTAASGLRLGSSARRQPLTPQSPNSDRPQDSKRHKR